MACGRTLSLCWLALPLKMAFLRPEVRALASESPTRRRPPVHMYTNHRKRIRARSGGTRTERIFVYSGDGLPTTDRSVSCDAVEVPTSGPVGARCGWYHVLCGPNPTHPLDALSLVFCRTWRRSWASWRRRSGGGTPTAWPVSSARPGRRIRKSCVTTVSCRGGGTLCAFPTCVFHSLHRTVGAQSPSRH